MSAPDCKHFRSELESALLLLDKAYQELHEHGDDSLLTNYVLECIEMAAAKLQKLLLSNDYFEPDPRATEVAE
jgi:hypothetical protein